jgi:hypothetical protein
MFTNGERSRPVRKSELTREIARWLLQLAPGDPMPTVRHMASRCRASLGATQGVVAGLEASGAVTVERQAQRAGVLVGSSVGQLWEHAMGEPIVISFPLAATPTIEGLATAVKALLAEHGLEAFLVFARGSRRRLADLAQNRAHAAMVSALSAGERDPARYVVALELAGGSYVREHRVFATDGTLSKGARLRVIVDRDSADLATLSRLEFGEQDAELVTATYMQFARLLHERRADAAVLDIEEVGGRLPGSVRNRPLSPHVVAQIGDSNTRAAVVTLRSERAVQRVLVRCLDPERVVAIQREVIEGSRVPEY